MKMTHITEEWALGMFFVGFLLSGLGVLSVMSLVYVKTKHDILVRKLRRRDEEIIDLKESLEKEKRNSGIDPLTGLYNRRFLDEKIDQLISWAERYKMPLSYLFIDLDNFKKVNDRLGHKEGDFVLRLVAGVIRNESRHTDTYVRLGGDEFLMALPGTTEQGAKEFAERLENVFSQTFLEGKIDPELNFGVSIGVSTHLIGDDFKKDIEKADREMYCVKERRKK